MDAIDRLAAADEITKLIHDYALFLDLNQPELHAATFTVDGVADFGNIEVLGREAIEAAVKPTLQEWVASCHTITNVQVTVTSESEATARCYLYAWRRVDPTGEGDYEVRGQYNDELARTEEGWRFARRTFRTIGATPPRPDAPGIGRRSRPQP